MKAAVLKAFGTPLVVEELPDPILGTGEVIVDVVATRVLPYMNEVLSGERNYALDLPLAPGAGAIGRIRAVGPDATKLRVGDWVSCDPTVRSRDDVLSPDIVLQGLTAAGEGGLKLQRYFRHGSFAEQIRVPTENVTPLGEFEPAQAPARCALGTCLVPYGGLLAIGFQPGETLLVSGATGNFGSAGIAVALAMGAASVVAPGRNTEVLADLTRRFGSRVRAFQLSGDEAADRENMKRAAPGPIDCVLDILPPSASLSAVRAAVMTVRPNGRVALMGGVGWAGGGELGLSYAWLMRNCVTIRGQWMYPREATLRLHGLVSAGLLRLDMWDTTVFSLDEVEKAVAHAAAERGPFKATVIEPQR